MLTRRLAALYNFVAPGRVVADVGTDHGYLIAELVESGRCPRGYACDINPQPLEKARSWIRKKGLSDRITLLCCDGLCQVPMDQVQEVVIAGMGGELISHILSACPALKREEVGLVLQPMSRAALLRRWLGENGFSLLKETALQENGFYYSVMRACYTGRRVSLSEAQARTGLLAGQTEPEAQAYLLRQREILARIAEQTARSPRMAEQSRHYQRDLAELEALLQPKSK